MTQIMADESAKKAAESDAEIENEVIDPPEIDSKYRMLILAAQRS